MADALTLASAQLAVAREYGFASRTRLRYEVTARTASLARQAEAVCEASIRDGTGRRPGCWRPPRARPLQFRGRALDVGKLRWVSEGGCVAARRAGSSPAAHFDIQKDDCDLAACL